MRSFLCFTVRFLRPCYHGRCDGAKPEWPPSPLRFYQSLVAAAAQRWCGAQFGEDATPSLQWLEQLPIHAILASAAEPAKAKYRLYVPDNIADKVAKSWSGGRDASIADYRTEKDVYPMQLSGDALHYLYPLPSGECQHFQTLATATRSITHLGWGVDMVVADASIISEQEVAKLSGERWRPVADSGTSALRTPIDGTLDDLIARHQSFLNRIGRDSRGNESLNPVPPLSAFRVVGYSRATDPVPRPCVVFELRNDDGTRFSYPQAKLIHLAGMVRHLAIEEMKVSPPEGVEDDWVETYVAGHAQPGTSEHRQFSYLPLPSIGHKHVDPSVRRVMVAAPLGDNRFLRHLAMLLSGHKLVPTSQTKIDCPPTLVKVRNDKVARLYTQPANTWASVTPVILPGHNDHKPAKTHKLIAKALAQSGIDQPCEFEWFAFSPFPKSLSAHKYDRNKQPTGYIRPDHLMSQTAVHLTLCFNGGLEVPGPLVIGAGRHCGFGLMAGMDR